jgi:ABC-2 type transport system ATP-binding protein
VSAALRSEGLGKRYGSAWALRDCSIEIPAGSVTALLGPNGAGKSTLLEMAVGLLEPSAGELRVLGRSPWTEAEELLPRVGFVAQEHPLHERFSLGEMLEYGRRLNPSFDGRLAERRLRRLGVAPDRKVGKLSGGQQSQVALTLALAKRPELLLLDEPVAALDPRARREFLATVVEAAAETGMTVVLSSHIVADLERICDHIVILSEAREVLSGSIEEIVERHRLLTGPRSDARAVARVHQVIRESHTPRQTTLLVRADGHVYDSRWTPREVDLEEIVLAYLGYGDVDAHLDAYEEEALA